MIDLIFASANNHKLEEVSKIVDTSAYALKNLRDVGILEEIIEDGSTLEENALIKARYVHQRLGLNVFSEDTGLEVAALGGDPGVYTARYGGPQKDANDNMNLLLKNLAPHQDRSAQFRAAVALIYEGQEVLFEGIVKGRIAMEKSGSDGFGYDPVFIPDGYEKSFAELPDAVKLGMSHRTRAVQKMFHFLENLS
ncbi:MAG: RdgB/HAM1 family non-canonical purine NTP pyrophosphatase [Bacteroidota bacterium]